MFLEGISFDIFLFLVSFLANFLSALSGGGAGLIQLPALIILGLNFPVALATHKVASVFLGIGSSLRHIQSNTMRLPYVLFILLCGIPGVIIGATYVDIVPESLSSLILGLLTISICLYSLSKPNLDSSSPYRTPSKSDIIIGGIVIFIIGILNGTFSSGTGLFVTLWLVKWFKFSYTQAVAYTLTLVGLFWNGSGALLLGLNGNINWNWLPALVLGSLFGGYLGAEFSLLKGNLFVKRSFEYLCFFMGITLIIRSQT